MLEHQEIFVDIYQCRHRVNKISNPGSRGASSLVFLHDALGSNPQWKEFPEALAGKTGLDAFLIERQGHGQSSPLFSNRDINYLHHEALVILPKLLDVLAISNPILVGHSDGASIGLIYAAHNEAVALISIAAHTFVEQEIRNSMDLVLENQEVLLTKLNKYHGEKTEQLFNAWWQTWMSEEFSDWTIIEELENIKCPVLVIQSDDDEFGTIKQVESIIENVSAPVQKQIIHEGGHAPHKRFPQEISEVTFEFLRKNGAILTN